MWPKQTHGSNHSIYYKILVGDILIELTHHDTDIYNTNCSYLVQIFIPPNLAWYCLEFITGIKTHGMCRVTQENRVQTT